MLVDERVAVADCGVGTNLASGKDWARNNVPVRVNQIALVGGSNIFDCALELSYGTVKVAHFFSTKGVASGYLDILEDDKFFLSSQKVCYPKSQINLEVISAPQTSPIRYMLNIQEVRR